MMYVIHFSTAAFVDKQQEPDEPQAPAVCQGLSSLLSFSQHVYL